MALTAVHNRAVRCSPSMAKQSIKSPPFGLARARRPRHSATFPATTTAVTPLQAYHPAREQGSPYKQRIVLGANATRNKKEEAESVVVFVAVLGFFLSGMFFVVPEVMIGIPAIWMAIERALSGGA